MGVSVDPDTVQGPEVTENVSLAELSPPEVCKLSVWVYIPAVVVIVKEEAVALVKVNVIDADVAAL